MTFREFLMTKLESCQQVKPKRETKTLTVYTVRSDRYPGYVTIQVPKPGTRGYVNNMAWALRKTAELFMWQNDYMYEAPIVRMIEEFEREENQ